MPSHRLTDQCRSRIVRRVATLVATMVSSLAFIIPQARAATSSPVAPYRLVKSDAPRLVVDGRLDDAVWKSAQAFDAFSENLPAPQPTSRHRTELRMLVAGHDLYIGVKSWDDNPAEIRAPLVRRDGVLGDQDFVAIYLDSVGTRTFAQFFRINARGILADGSWNDQIGNEDFSPDFEYEGAAAQFADESGRGWSAEMRIPLTSLRMPDPPPAEWSFVFFNSWTRDTRYRAANVPLPRDWSCMLCIAQSIELPADMPRATGWSVTPHATYSGHRDTNLGTTLENERRIRAGVDAKWRITGDTIIDATINPDFSQIELDAPQLSANTRFALSFPEKRPFFLEGSDLFDMPLRAVYTRSFTDPRWGARITQRAATRDFIVLAAHDEGGGFTLLPGPYGTGVSGQRAARSVVARARQHFGNVSLAQVATIRRDDEGRSNVVAAGDALIRIDNDSRIRLQALGSRTDDPDWRASTVNGSAIAAEYFYLSSRWELNGGGEAVSRHFRADHGFVAQNDYVRAQGAVTRKFQDVGPWYELSMFVNGEHRQTMSGRTLLNGLRVGSFGNMSRNTWLTVEPRYESVRVTENGPLHDLRYLHMRIESTPLPWLAFLQWSVEAGDRVDVANDRRGRGAAITGYTRMRFFERTELDVRSNWQWVRVDAPGGARRVLTERALQVTGVFHVDARNNVRVIAQDGSTSRNPELFADPAISAKDKSKVLSVVYAYRAGLQMSVYVGASTYRARDPDSHVDRRTNEAFVKVAYTFMG